MYVGDNATQDVLLFLGNQTSGSYSLEYNLYVPAGKEGYYKRSQFLPRKEFAYIPFFS